MAKFNSDIFREFASIFPNKTSETKPRAFFAPGRVNLIGEHTDYTGGFVMPMALNLGITMLVRLRDDGLYQLKSLNFEEEVTFTNEDITDKKEDSWGNYPRGIIYQLLEKGVDLRGADILYVSDLPVGSGLSSSAAISMVTAYALSTLKGLEPNVKELAFLSQKMENEFIGVKSGIMDQIAVGFGKKDCVVFLDCQSLEWELVPFALEGISVVITDSGKRRGLRHSRYNERREESEEALKIIQSLKPEIESFRDLSIDDVDFVNKNLRYPYRERARHIITENNRVIRAKESLLSGEVSHLGQLMLASHRSLAIDYEVTGRELDSLFLAQLNAGCFATRMCGAGFGGCTVSLVDNDKIELFKENVASMYTEETGLNPEFHVVESGDGVREIEVD